MFLAWFPSFIDVAAILAPCGKPFDGAGVGRELNPPINCHTSFGEAGILTAADAFPIAKLLGLFVSW